MGEVTRISSDPEVATASPAAAETATAQGAASVLERYKVSLRRYSPVPKGLAGLPWKGE